MELEALIYQVENFHLDLKELQEEVSLLKFEKEELEGKVKGLEDRLSRLCYHH